MSAGHIFLPLYCLLGNGAPTQCAESLYINEQYSPTDIHSGQLNLDNPLLRHNSQVIVACVTLKTETNHLTN